MSYLQIQVGGTLVYERCIYTQGTGSLTHQLGSARIAEIGS